MLLSRGSQPVPQLQLTTHFRLTQIYHIINSGTVFVSLQSTTSQASSICTALSTILQVPTTAQRQEHLGDERVLAVHHEGKAGQEPKAGQDLTAGTEAQTTEESCSPVWTLLAYSVSFFTPQDCYPGMAQPRVGWPPTHTHQSSIKKMLPQACLQANMVGALSQLAVPSSQLVSS